MISSMRRVIRFQVVGVLSLLATAAFLGCAGANPFLSAQFATTFGNLPGRQTGTPFVPPTQPGTDTSALASVCDLAAALRTMTISMRNESTQEIHFAMSLLVSAGTGGFACADELQNYTNAGYAQVSDPGSPTTFTIGCDQVRLLTGTQILRRTFGVERSPEIVLQPNQPGNQGGNVPTIQLTVGQANTPNIPLPEVIVFGTTSAVTLTSGVTHNFSCVGNNPNDPCSQLGFIYTNVQDVQVGKPVEASRIQGTQCQTGFGVRPEWLLDKTLNDNQTATFQFPVGAQVVVTVLDRAGDAPSDSRNQVVWTVTDANGNVIHDQAP